MTSQAIGHGHGGGRGGGHGKGKGRVDALQQEMHIDEDGGSSELSGNQSEGFEKKETLRWTPDQLRTLVDFLYKNKAASGEGSFKTTAYNAAAKHLNETYPSMPILKGTQVKTKYSSSSSSVSEPFYQ